MAKARPNITTGDFKIICTIGSGSYGTCKKIQRLKDNKMFVWKELDYSSASEADKIALVSEVNLLRELKHENIVRYIDRIIDKKKSTLYLIMEYCESGDLAAYINKIKKEGGCIAESYIWRVCHQLTLALKECHSRQRNGRSVLHRDLKPANIFLDAKMNVKLGDFGLARVLNHENSFARTCVGTPLYMSPEQMSGGAYNAKSDVWALGCLLYELAVLSPPFSANNQLELAAKICIGIFHRIPSFYSNDLHSFISTLLAIDPSRRPTIDQLLTDASLLKGVMPQIETQPSLLTTYTSQENSEVDSLKREIIKLNEELNVKRDELKKCKMEYQLKNKDLEKKQRDLAEHQKSVQILEQVAQEKLQRAEQLMVYLQRSQFQDSSQSSDICVQQHSLMSHQLSCPCTCYLSNYPSKPPKCPNEARLKSNITEINTLYANISPSVPKIQRRQSRGRCSVVEIPCSPFDRKRTLSNPRHSGCILEKRSKCSPRSEKNVVRRSESMEIRLSQNDEALLVHSEQTRIKNLKDKENRPVIGSCVGSKDLIWGVKRDSCSESRQPIGYFVNNKMISESRNPLTQINQTNNYKNYAKMSPLKVVHPTKVYSK